MPENTDSMANKTPIERLAEKQKNAELAAQRDSEIKPSSAPVTTREAAQIPQASSEASVRPTDKAESADAKVLNVGQGENANGEQDSKAALAEGSFEAQGHTKVTREEGKPAEQQQVDVVQQGGGGVVNADTGLPIR